MFSARATDKSSGCDPDALYWDGSASLTNWPPARLQGIGPAKLVQLNVAYHLGTKPPRQGLRSMAQGLRTRLVGISGAGHRCDGCLAGSFVRLRFTSSQSRCRRKVRLRISPSRRVGFAKRNAAREQLIKTPREVVLPGRFVFGPCPPELTPLARLIFRSRERQGSPLQRFRSRQCC